LPFPSREQNDEFESTVAVGAGRVKSQTLHDHATWWLAAILITTALGFQRTITERLGELDLAHMAHGICSTVWLLVLIVQAELARRRRRDAHRLLAIVGTVSALGIAMTSLPMLASTLAASTKVPPPVVPMLRELVVMDTWLLVLFAGAFAMAVSHLKRSAVHGRAMAVTALVALPPGIGRWYMRLFGVDPVVGSRIALATAAALLVALIVTDRRAGVRDRVYTAALAVVLLTGLSSPWITRAVFG
jgi:hypothetical protein